MDTAKKISVQSRPHSRFSRRWHNDKWYLFFILPTILLLFFFSYLPMYGLAIAFQEYSIGAPLFPLDGTGKWVGLKFFNDFLGSIFFRRVMYNTLRLSLLNLVFGAWVPLAVALLLNEVRLILVKRVLQTVYYMPYFISTVVMVSMLSLLLNPNGPLSAINVLRGGDPINFMSNPKYFDTIYVASNIWKSFGYSSIIYLAGIAGVDVALYEAIMIDGGNRWHKMRHVTLPHILPTFVILLVLSVGGILNSNTEQILLMYNSGTMDRADVIGTYVYRLGLVDAKYSYTAAVGLFTNIINFVFVFGANQLSRKVMGYSLW